MSSDSSVKIGFEFNKNDLEPVPNGTDALKVHFNFSDNPMVSLWVVGGLPEDGIKLLKKRSSIKSPRYSIEIVEENIKTQTFLHFCESLGTVRNGKSLKCVCGTKYTQYYFKQTHAYSKCFEKKLRNDQLISTNYGVLWRSLNNKKCFNSEKTPEKEILFRNVLHRICKGVYILVSKEEMKTIIVEFLENSLNKWFEKVRVGENPVEFGVDFHERQFCLEFLKKHFEKNEYKKYTQFSSLHPKMLGKVEFGEMYYVVKKKFPRINISEGKLRKLIITLKSWLKYFPLALLEKPESLYSSCFVSLISSFLSVLELPLIIKGEYGCRDEENLNLLQFRDDELWSGVVHGSIDYVIKLRNSVDPIPNLRIGFEIKTEKTFDENEKSTQCEGYVLAMLEKAIREEGKKNEDMFVVIKTNLFSFQLFFASIHEGWVSGEKTKKLNFLKNTGKEEFSCGSDFSQVVEIIARVLTWYSDRFGDASYWRQKYERERGMNEKLENAIRDFMNK